MGEQIRLKNALLQEEYLSICHKSGLTLLLYPNQAYSSVTACYAVHYGSSDNIFRVAPGKEVQKVPEGIAHFLEHKLFEDEKGDAFARFGETGASANAFTSYDKTAFYFTCTERFEENLEILLDFVQTPYFTEQTVQKEQGIIAQEIKMYDDNPDWQVYFGLLQSLYHKHSVRIDTAGSVESIAKITPKLLYDCYHAFYRPENMVLAVAGNFEVETVLNCCDRMIHQSNPFTVERLPEAEPETLCRQTQIKAMPVSKPQFCMGFKQRPQIGKKRLEAYLLSDLAADCLFGDSTDFYRELYNKGLINSCFSAGVLEGDGFMTLICEGESEDVDAVADALCSRVKQVKESGIEPRVLSGVLKTHFGKQVKQFGDPSSLAMQMMDAEFCGTDLFAPVEILRRVTAEQLNAFIRAELDESLLAVSAVVPITEENEVNE